MTANKEIFNFITKPENISIALEVATYVEELKVNTHIRFWEGMNSSIAQKLKSEHLSATWKLEPFHNKYNKEWAMMSILPVLSGGTNSPKLSIRLSQASRREGYQLYRGVIWKPSLPPDFTHPAIFNIKEILIRHDCNRITDPVWIGWGFEGLKPISAEFLSGMNNEPDQLVEKVVEDLWQIFTECRQYMEEINAALEKK